MKSRIVLKWSSLFSLFIGLFIILNSGSMFQSIYGELFQQIIFIVFSFVLIYLIANKGFNLFKIKLNYYTVFMAIVAVMSIICMIIWNDYSLIILYISNFAIFFLSYLIASKINIDTFLHISVNIIFIIAIISLFGWLFTDTILNLGIGFDFSRYMEYRSLIIFNIIKNAPMRNCGIFWEPGMFQGFLNFAILTIILNKKLTVKNIIKVLVLALAVYTTFSTTGYIILAMLIVLLIYKLLYNVSKPIAMLLIVSCGILFVFTNGFSDIIAWATAYLPREITQKIIDQNISYTTRIYNILYDMELSIKNPFGVGRNYAWSLIQDLSSKYGYAVNARTSAISTAFINYGFLCGLFYFFLWIKGCVNFSIRKAKGDVVYFLIVFLIMMAILNSEPVFFHLFFNIILVLWLKNDRKIVGEYNENLMAK